MRIITGKAKGKRLFTPGNLKIRPTSDKVREALFDVLGDLIINAYFLDLYAGTGAVAIEALSRGAKYAAIVEKNRAALKLIDNNLQHCGLADKAIVVAYDVKKALAKLSKYKLCYDIVYIDPPYKSDLLKDTLSLLVSNKLIKSQSIVIAEHPAKFDFECEKNNLFLYRQKKYGKTYLSFYRLI